MAKYVVEWCNSIGLFNKQTYIVPVNPIVIICCHYQYRIFPLKQNLFGWFTYRCFLTATCWNNRNVRVESAAGKTVHKLFVGGVCLSGTLGYISHNQPLKINHGLIIWTHRFMWINYVSGRETTRKFCNNTQHLKHGNTANKEQGINILRDIKYMHINMYNHNWQQRIKAFSMPNLRIENGYNC